MDISDGGDNRLHPLLCMKQKAIYYVESESELDLQLAAGFPVKSRISSSGYRIPLPLLVSQ